MPSSASAVKWRVCEAKSASTSAEKIRLSLIGSPQQRCFHRLHRFSPFCETSVMRRLLFALASVFQTDVFVECEVAVAAIFHPLDVDGADAVILETHQLFDWKIVVAEIFEFANE